MQFVSQILSVGVLLTMFGVWYSSLIVPSFEFAIEPLRSIFIHFSILNEFIDIPLIFGLLALGLTLMSTLTVFRIAFFIYHQIQKI